MRARLQVTDNLLGNMPPINLEAEFNVLSAILLDESGEAMRLAAERLARAYFYKSENGRIFDAMLSIHKRKESVDATALITELRAQGRLEEVGGPSWIGSLVVASSANVARDIKLVFEAFLARRTREALQQGLNHMDRSRDPLPDRIAHVERLVTTATSIGMKTRIDVTPDILTMVERGEAALEHAGEEIFVHGRALVRVLRDERGPRIEPLTFPIAKGLLSRHATWVGLKDGEPRPVLPPKDVVESFLAIGRWSFPVLDAITTSPTLRRDGTVVSTPGYDELSRILYEPDAKYPPIPEHPTLEDARRALAELAEPFSEFPFVGGSDRSAALALVLALIARHAIDGPVPMTLVRANAPGSGKSLLVDTIAAIGTGRHAARLTLARSDEEEEKKLVALGREGAPLVLLDNVERQLSSEILAAALTARTYKARVLGSSQMAEFLVPIFTATGNNVVVAGDLGRRVVPVDLEVQLERPEERSGFRRQLPGWVLENRPRLVVAALTALRAYFAAGRPTQALAAYGSFEAWSSVPRSVLVWAGLPDPCAGRVRIRDDSDLALADIRQALQEWVRVFAGESITSAEALAACERDARLREALAGLTGVDPMKLDARKLGRALRRVTRRIVDGLSFDRGVDSHAKVAKWCVARRDCAGIAGIGNGETRVETRTGNANGTNDIDTAAGDAGSFSQSPRTKDQPRIGEGPGLTPRTPPTPQWVDEPSEADEEDGDE